MILDGYTLVYYPAVTALVFMSDLSNYSAGCSGFVLHRKFRWVAIGRVMEFLAGGSPQPGVGSESQFLSG